MEMEVKHEGMSMQQLTKKDMDDFFDYVKGHLKNSVSFGIGFLYKYGRHIVAFDNLATGLLVAYSYWNSPTAAFIEYVPDFILHFANIYALEKKDTVFITKLLFTFANVARMMQAGVAYTTGDSTVPSFLNALDTFKHIMMLGFLSNDTMKQKEPKVSANTMFMQSSKEGKEPEEEQNFETKKVA